MKFKLSTILYGNLNKNYCSSFVNFISHISLGNFEKPFFSKCIFYLFVIIIVHFNSLIYISYLKHVLLLLLRWFFFWFLNLKFVFFCCCIGNTWISLQKQCHYKSLQYIIFYVSCLFTNIMTDPAVISFCLTRKYTLFKLSYSQKRLKT